MCVCAAMSIAAWRDVVCVVCGGVWYVRNVLCEGVWCVEGDGCGASRMLCVQDVVCLVDSVCGGLW